MSLESLSWTSEHVEVANDLRTQLIQSKAWVNRGPLQVLRFYTNASGIFCARVVTQSTTKPSSLARNEQRHELLAFLSLEFMDRQVFCTTCEREEYAVLQTFRKLIHLLVGDEHTIVPSHYKNELLIFSPLAFESALGSFNILKVTQ